MDITLTFVGLFLLGCGLGSPVVIFAKNRGPIPWLLMPMIAFSLPLFTIGPHPTILGLYLPFAVYLLYVGQMVIRNPSAINEFWRDFGNEGRAEGYPYQPPLLCPHHRGFDEVPLDDGHRMLG